MTVVLHSYKGGQQWGRGPELALGFAGLPSDRVLFSPGLPDGFAHIEHEIDGQVLYEYRTKGDPKTAHTCWLDYGAAIREASRRFRIPVAVLFGTICIEATKWRDDKSHFNSRCYREEPGYRNDDDTPNKISPGLGQTLISTAQGENDKHRVYLNYDGTVEQFTREDLFIAERSIMMMACYLRTQFDKYESDELAAGLDPDDPLAAWSAYNAGSVRETDRNDFKMLTYGETRLDKAMAYHNDLIAFLRGTCC